jgi:iron(III)-salmochelin esterase
VKVELTRRTLFGGVAALTAHCSRAESAGTGPTSSPVASASAAASVVRGGDAVKEKELDFASTPVGPEKALALVPGWGLPEERFPVLVALHGRGEAVRGIAVGARAWLSDYELGRTIARLRSPPLTRRDFQGFVGEDRLARINASLEQRPFRGLIVVCPWVPDLLSDKDKGSLDSGVAFGDFVVDQLLPRVLAETPAKNHPPAVGIDGVSLGGRVALLVGLSHPDRFSALGTLQAAIQGSEAETLARRAQHAFPEGTARRLRLLTSTQDYFQEPITALHSALLTDQVAHDFVVVPGPHDYAFNRGPGGIEMLLWHDRVLRQEPPI